MQRIQLDSESRFSAYVKSITLFILYGHLAEARGIWGRMQAEGYIPPRQIQATMAIMQSLTLENPEEPLFKSATKAFALESFGEEEFRTVLRIVFRLTHFPVNVYTKLVNLFLKSRGIKRGQLSPRTMALISYISSRRGGLGKVHKYPLPLTVQEPDENRAATLASIHEMASSDPQLAPVIYSALQRMEINDGSYDRIFYNVILSAMAQRERYSELFALYKMMMNGSTSMLPDAFTFGTLLNAIRSFSGPRNLHTRKHKRPTNTLSLRELYRDVIYCHNRFTRTNTSSIALNGSLLNRVIGSFVATHDYAAAFVAIRTFDHFSIPVTITTYRSVLSGIISRLEEEYPRFKYSTNPERFWGYRFLGCPDIAPLLDIRVVEAILQSDGQATLQLRPFELWTDEELFNYTEAISEYAASGSRSNRLGVTFRHLPNKRDGKTGYNVPTAVTLIGLLDNPMDVFSAVPLQRIVRRAIRAGHPRVFLSPNRVISLDIQYAKSDMLPTSTTTPKATETTTSS